MITMLKNYPAAYLLIISLLFLIGLTAIAPLVEGWHIFWTILFESLIFVLKVICIFFLFGTVIELMNNIHFQKRHH